MDVDLTFEAMPALDELLGAIAARGVQCRDGDTVFATWDGDYDWERRTLAEWPVVVAEMGRTFAAGQSVGFVITWPDGVRNGRLLVMPQLRTVSFAPDVGTLSQGSAPSSTGLGCYLDELVTMFAGLDLLSVSASNEP